MTVALAYVKELDVITAKRLEMANTPKPTGPGGGDANPKQSPTQSGGESMESLGHSPKRKKKQGEPSDR